MIAAMAITLAINLKTSPNAAEMSSANMVNENDPGRRSHSPIHERVNIAWKVNRK
jgi:hypothetical protein